MLKKILSVSEFFNSDIPPLILGAFFSRYIFINNGEYIVTLASFKKSKKVDVIKIDYNNYNDTYIKILNEESMPYNYWQTKKDIDKSIKLPRGQAFFILKNDINITEESFYNRLYAKLLSDCSWFSADTLTEEKKSFIRGYMELRGSIDTSADYISQDYYYHSIFEIKKARLLVDYLSVPYYVVNINFRELQEQYYKKINQRNPQFRLNIRWYMKNIGILNEYKANVFQLSRNLDGYKKIGNVCYFEIDDINYRESSILDNRLNYYSTNIFGKEITEKQIEEMRANLGFDKENKSIRDSDLVELIKLFEPDECMACKNKYNIEERTFVNKKTNKLYFEVHHVISLGKNKELDDENNLVKLCPTCHKTLKKGVATEEKQKELITEIFKNAPKTLEFAKHFFDNDNIDEVIDLTFKKLK